MIPYDQPVNEAAGALGRLPCLVHGILVGLDDEHEGDGEAELLLHVEQVGFVHPVEEDALVGANTVDDDEIAIVKGLDDLVEVLTVRMSRNFALG